ncbi:histidine phosphatase family protein [Paractinoplanes atraurantiacus]|uniref:Probable phosphoglycerate mutase n=1 Tax=Paractinoplanes atraurantiacus TaxID=1036182 RepID=A0A285HZ98_9ACTN|nr:histidine phosphatase family protein [Actinoplanes atraurantiacus]SNY41019.1 probable phosphoglycerate mutase [Actinoplanes atraurantiacus]
MRNVYVVTHPEATHHLEKVVGGWHDSRLTADGLSAASVIAQTLRGAIPEDVQVALSSSDLRRTRETADAIGRVFGVEARLDRGLREKSYGVAEGRPQEWLRRHFVPPPAVGDRMNHDEGIEGAETRTAFATRVYAAVDELLRQPAEHHIVVTHGFAFTFVVAAWIKMPIESLGYVNMHVPPGSITTLREDGYFHNRQVVTLGFQPSIRRTPSSTTSGPELR